jgi:release factor glutamine methyltransferase
MRKIKSYSRIIGKSLSKSAKQLIENALPQYQINEEQIPILHNLHVEIGFGDGDNLHALATNNPLHNFLGIEVYLNGVCNLLKLCEANKLKNLFIYPDDADLLLHKIPDNFVKAFFILFPDPWTKNRHTKRRLLNQERIELLIRKLEPSGIIRFITDVENYFIQVKALFLEQPLLDLVCNDVNGFEAKYSPTKYHQKALIEEKQIFVLTAKKLPLVVNL